MSEFKMKGFSMLFGTDKHKDATEAKRKASVKEQAANPGKANCPSTPAKKYKKGAPGKFIAKAAGMLIGANKQRQAAKDAAEQAKQKGIEAAMSRKL